MKLGKKMVENIIRHDANEIFMQWVNNKLVLQGQGGDPFNLWDMLQLAFYLMKLTNQQ